MWAGQSSFEWWASRLTTWSSVRLLLLDCWPITIYRSKGEGLSDINVEVTVMTVALWWQRDMGGITGWSCTADTGIWTVPGCPVRNTCDTAPSWDGKNKSNKWNRTHKRASRVGRYYDSIVYWGWLTATVDSDIMMIWHCNVISKRFNRYGWKYSQIIDSLHFNLSHCIISNPNAGVHSQNNNKTSCHFTNTLSSLYISALLGQLWCLDWLAHRGHGTVYGLSVGRC